MSQGPAEAKELNLDEILARIEERQGGEPPTGRTFWRSLEELAGSDEFPESLQAEFPYAAAEWPENASRRGFLKLMGASLALAGVYGCTSRKDEEKIVPYVNPPEAVVAGRPMYFASTFPLNGFGKGVIVQSREGRPIKVEGNPAHPASLGGSDIWMQASILQLYDPERSKVCLHLENVTTWTSFLDALRHRLDAKKSAGGDGVRILTGVVTSPTLGAQLKQFKQQFPRAIWHQWDPVARVNTLAGGANPVYQFDKAKVILSLDSNFLLEDPGSLRYSRNFMDGRRVRKDPDRQEMNRLYVVESTYTITGTMADHRLPMKPSQIEAFARAVAARLAGGADATPATGPSAAEDRWVRAVANDLRKNSGAVLVIAGESQPPAVHALARQINETLGSVGKTVQYTERVEAEPVNVFDSIRQLSDDMAAGKVDTLLILGENPAYTAPAELKFAERLKAMSLSSSNGGLDKFTAHVGLHEDETSYVCQWHIPETHYLESWGDARAYDGTISIMQPLIGPLHESRTAVEMLEAILGRPQNSGYEIVRAYWQGQWQNFNSADKPENAQKDFEGWWHNVLRHGIIPGSAAKPTQGAAPAPDAAQAPAASQPASGREIVFRPDPTIWDGTYSNNGWLQELPKPLTKLVWDNAAHVSPRTARDLGVELGDIVKLTQDGQSVEAPIYPLPGQPDDVVTVTLGYGRARGGHTAVRDSDNDEHGFNAYALRTARTAGFGTGLTIEVTGKKKKLVTTRNHHGMDTITGTSEALKPHVLTSGDDPQQEDEIRNRRLVRTGSLEEFRKSVKDGKHFARELGVESEKKPLLSLYPNSWDYSKGYQWGMSIDQQSCIGCNACVIACQAENNIPVVGKEQVSRQRDMQWIRIDDYYATGPDRDVNNPEVYHQPVPCMHCENAPCEYVCPVGATSHSPEGINEMTYNRCVGTRYCSNNCPYKVRRFNFLEFNPDVPPLAALQKNPDVTVRSRGVMEKCTYCIHRINRTRIEIEKMIVRAEERVNDPKSSLSQQQKDMVRDDIRQQEHAMLEQLETACQQACPTEAIVFGNVNDQMLVKPTRVATIKKEPLDYVLLADLTTKPRTSYMARIWNKNPELAVAGGHEAGGEG